MRRLHLFSAHALSDVHRRTHLSLTRLIDHCGRLPARDLDRILHGFGYGTIRLQLHHIISCERYWVGVLHGEMLVDERDEDRDSIAALRAFRERTFEATADYLAAASELELNTPREMTTWGAGDRSLVPAFVILRTQTHAYQHQGQVAAMCRLVDHPIPAGLDFPID